MRQVDTQVLSEVAQSVRKYTRKRMHFVTYLPMYKADLTANTMTLNLTVVEASNETPALNELIKQGFYQAKILKKLSNQMLCEGECSYFQLYDEKITLSVAYFNKHISSRVVTIPLPKRRAIKFNVCSSDGRSTILEGEVFV